MSDSGESKEVTLSKYRFEQSYRCLRSAKLLLGDDDYRGAANRSYYSIYNAIRSIFALDGVEFRRHSGNISHFRKEYIQTGIFDKELSQIVGDVIMLTIEYKNFIFDLYGTLIDIFTDERKPSLWRLMAEFYNVYGCRWKAKSLSETFWKMDKEEREIMREESGIEYPEIKLERVFSRLLFEGPGCDEDQNKTNAWFECSMKIAGEPIDDLRRLYLTDKERVLETVASSDWCVAAANLFRVHSRKYIRPYTGTILTLHKLREQGRGVYLLSNAQRIFTMPEIEMTGLDLLFDKMYISSDYGMMKPERTFMELLLKEEKLDLEDSVMVGNEFKCDIAIALRCGMDSIYLNTASHTKSEIDKEWMTLMKKEDKSMGTAPHVIMSGDIAEILNLT